MSNEKEKFDQLSQDELKDVTGGIPYEIPALIDLSDPLASCGSGTICSGGNGDTCADGRVCTKGGTVPNPDPNPL